MNSINKRSLVFSQGKYFAAGKFDPCREVKDLRRGDRKDQIVAAAKELFHTKGYHATSVRDIADALGILSGSLYAHISSKEDLLYAIADEAADQFVAEVTPLLTASGSAAERLQLAMRKHMQVIADHLSTASVFFHEWRSLEPDRREAINEKRQRVEAVFRQLVDEGIASGEFGQVDPKFAALLVLSALNWSYQWYSPDGPLGPEEIADKYAELVLTGLRHAGRGNSTQ